MSLPLSIDASFKRYRTAGYSPIKATWMCVLKCLKRAVILYVLNSLINQSQSFDTIRILGGMLCTLLSTSSRLLLRLWTSEFSGSSLHAGLASRSRSHESMESAFRVQSESECVSCVGLVSLCSLDLTGSFLRSLLHCRLSCGGSCSVTGSLQSTWPRLDVRWDIRGLEERVTMDCSMGAQVESIATSM